MNDPVLVAVGGLLLLLLTGAAGIVGRSLFGARAKLIRRAEQIVGTSRGGAKEGKGSGGAPRRKAIQAKLKELEEKRQSGKETLQDRITQGGLTLSVKQFLIIGLGFGVVCGLLALIKFSPVAAVLVTIAMGVGFPRMVLTFLIKRRIKKFTAGFANAIDVIVRGIRTGLPVGECLNMIGREFADPIGFEFRSITEGQRLGMSLEDVLQRSVRRMPTPEMKFFSIVLIIQKQTGGNLADTLGKLSDVLRERKKMRDKIVALSSEAKASAMIIGSLPFLVGGGLYLTNGASMSLLFTTTAGNVMLVGSAIWMSLGVLVMRQMINFEI